MESLIPIYRLMHFIGLALLLGGTLSSLIMVNREGRSKNSIKMAYNCMHLVAAPGLMLLILTGILQSSALYWAHFKNAGYMHAKIAFAVLILALMFVDMRTQKRILRESHELDVLVSQVKKRQVLAIAICGLTIVIMWLVSYRPF